MVERIFKHRIRHQIEIDDLQFGVVKGKAMIGAICHKTYAGEI